MPWGARARGTRHERLAYKFIEQSIEDTDDPEYQLKKRLTWLDLTVFGVGVVIGAGIFTLTGRAAQAYAGPGIVLSFVYGYRRSRLDTGGSAPGPKAGASSTTL